LAHAAKLADEVRIRRLWPADVSAYREHLLRLDADARYSRFGTFVSTEVVAEHAHGCFGAGTFVFGCFIDGVIRAAAEMHVLEPAAPAFLRAGEAAFSVEREFRHEGLGSALVERVILAARNRGLQLLVMSCLPQNFAMQKLAKKFGATLKCEPDEVTGKVRIELPTPQTIFEELVEDSLDFTASLFDLQRRIFHIPSRHAA